MNTYNGLDLPIVGTYVPKLKFENECMEFPFDAGLQSVLIPDTLEAVVRGKLNAVLLDDGCVLGWHNGALLFAKFMAPKMLPTNLVFLTEDDMCWTSTEQQGLRVRSFPSYCSARSAGNIISYNRYFHEVVISGEHPHRKVLFMNHGDTVNEPVELEFTEPGAVYFAALHWTGDISIDYLLTFEVYTRLCCRDLTPDTLEKFKHLINKDSFTDLSKKAGLSMSNQL